MRRTISMFLASIMLLGVFISTPVTAFAEETTVDFQFEKADNGTADNSEDDYAILLNVSNPNETIDNVIIPLTAIISGEELKVKKISANAFSECTNLKYIFFEGTQEEVGDIEVPLKSENPDEAYKIHYGAKDHTRKETITKYCDKEGSRVVECTVCGDKFVDEVIDATGHKFESWAITTMPTCTEKGEMSRTCENEWCDSDYTDDDTKTPVTETEELAISENAHSFGEWEEIQAPTCTEKGLEKRVCTLNAEHTETRETDALGHKYSDTFTVDTPATCTEDGSKSRHCVHANCNEVTDETSIPKGHDLTETIIDEASCKELGKKHIECKNCDYEEEADIEKIPHTPSSNWSFGEDSTCDSEGYLYKKCTACGEETERTAIEKKSHEFGEWEEVTASTCETKGSEKRECKNCDFSEIKEIDELGHAYEAEFTVDIEPTCTEKGSKSKHCTRCDSKSEVTEIDELGHNYAEEFTVDVEPTCTEKGSESKHCTRCDSKTEIRDIEATGHIDFDLVTEKEATCTEAGIVNKICKCGEFLEKLTIEPKEHTLSEWIVDKDATCTEAGSKHIECTVCEGVLKTEIIAVAGHKFGEWEVTKEATCSEDGAKHRICSVCEEKEDTVIEKIAHKNAELQNEKEATCLEKGYSGDLYCPDCKEIIEDGEEIKAKGHTASEWITDKAPTFTETGTQHKECTVCKEELETGIVDKLTLKTPAVKVSNDEKGVKVSWGKDENALKYTVYSSEYNSSTKKWSSWKNRGTLKATKLSWIDEKAKNGKTYRYTVRAVNGKFKSAYKASSEIIFITMPKAPSLSVKSNGINVKWSKISGATGYTVYSSQLNTETGKWTSWKNRGTVKSNVSSWLDKKAESGVTYRYTVRALNGKSKSDYVASKSLIFLAQPVLKISNGANGIVGSWKTIEGAEGYIIYRSEYNTKTKKWSSWLNLGTTKETAKSFTDKTVKNNVKYKYTLRAINGKVKSTYKASNELLRLAEVTVKITITADGLKGSWNKVSGATGYTVYRSELNNETGKWTSWKNLGTAKSTAKTFTDKTVKSGVTYKYAVRAINGKSKSSYIESDGMIFLSVPQVKIANNSSGLKVSWGKTDGAKAYTVYRSELNTKTNKWTSWKTLTSDVEGTKKSFIDETAKSGVTYRYTVRAVNEKVRSAYKASASLFYLEAPEVIAKFDGSEVNVTWDKVDGAKTYTVYRAEKIEDEWTGWENLGSVKKAEYIDEKAETESIYRYTVRAVNGKVKSAYVAGNEVEVLTESTEKEENKTPEAQ